MSSIKRAITVLELLARKGPMGVRAIASEAKLPIGSTHRLLTDLEEEQVLLRTPDNEWGLSHRLLGITGMQLDRFSLTRLARPFCEEICQKTGETVNINVLLDGQSVCIDKYRANEGMQLDAPVGSRGTLYCGGAGKALLAYLEPAEREAVYAAPMTPLTAHTITDASALRDEVAKIRARGFSLDNEEIVIGVFCVSMVVLDHQANPVSAISISGPNRKTDGPELQPLVEMLSEVCGATSRALGYNGVWPPVKSDA